LTIDSEEVKVVSREEDKREEVVKEVKEKNRRKTENRE